ncbi:hypothetical protein [Halopseudomonas salina]|uniref:Uncharacterized protein n=1 Tax=Halopseudomonas salina TaxID=1323744 RepID=A0ABQ1PYD4_9GAMM|nr:hypothetical protein [Halopseudomonas salina]GGD07540.1 hypothetical protein GCM10007418_28210 [Halopseudomonas salina]
MLLRLKGLIVLTLLFLAPFANANLERLQTAHEFRSEGYTVGTYLLIDNNLFERIREPGNRETYREALSRMENLLRQMDSPAQLRVPFDTFVNLIRELEALPGEEAHYGLATVNRIMKAHGDVDSAAAAMYDELKEAASEDLLALHRQSIETSQILTLYQNNMFSSIGVYFLENKEGLFDDLDQSIVSRSDELKKLYPDQAGAFARMDKQYQFIQPRLQNPLYDWVPTIAAFYLQRNIETLNDMAREQVQSGA